MGPAVAHAPDVTGMVAARRLGADADIDRDAGRPQPCMARTGASGLGSSSATRRGRDPQR